jgi:RimJ/RimL family protein N-acetyltransferase
MKEALQGLLSAAFSDLGLRRVEAEVNPANLASVRLLERLGFAHEGVLRQRWVAKGQAYDVAVYGLLRDDWRPRPGLIDDHSHARAP